MKSKLIFATSLLAATMLSGTAMSRVIDFKIESTGPAIEGTSFGEVGAYERIDAIATIAVKPDDPANAGIVGLDKAPRDKHGDVVFTSEVSILRPSDENSRSPFLFYEVPNRGRNLSFMLLNASHSSAVPTKPEDAGDGFLLSQGDTIVWNGWQPFLGEKLLNVTLPVEKGVTGISREQKIFDKPGETGTLKLTYPAADLDPAKAKITVRVNDTDEATTPKDLSFKYVSENEVEITRPASMPAGAIYEFIYPAKDAVPAGLSMAGIRDVVSFLRGNPGHEAKNPLSGIEHTVGMGISQSGRLMRDIIYQGFNADEQGNKVFDGAMIHIAGSRKTYSNYAFAQQGRYSRQHEDHDYQGDQFPFTYVSMTDPVSGETDGILDTCEASETCPVIMQSDTSTEFWQARAYLLSTSPDGKALTMPDNVRLYFIEGTQHFSLLGAKPAAKDPAANLNNPLSVTPVLRALYEDMKDWVAEGVEPPASRYPSVANGTLVTPAKLNFPTISGKATTPKFNKLQVMDYSVQPPARGAAYPELVPALDVDGNELGGVELPRLAAPLGTYTGWNPRAEGFAAGELYTTQGSFFAFPATVAEGDNRTPLSDRYADKAAYQAAVKAAAEDLVDDRLMRAEDVDQVVDLAGKDYDALH
ncbi:alpha/beta hydrolase domain-containing protein [Breoghania sp.]|uniref:alpha/beta hydrolase domain-containing protein n=1 Tax=Breoghania sp. TaxID=2065378 RepID=UPI002AA83179|nr:alpha/beta hydrolase domain-containing protein [Breoghania sp.]